MQSAQHLNILLVDDDPLVHQSTQFALDHSLILGKPLHFLHAHSAQQAQSLLEANLAPCPDLLIIDLLMETPTAGADLCFWIKKHLNPPPALILRSGQTGLSAEHEKTLTFQGVHILNKGAQTVALLKDTIEQALNTSKTMQ